MSKDFNFKSVLYRVLFSLIVLFSAIFSIYYLEIHSEDYKSLFKTFSLDVKDVQGIIFFTVAFYAIIQLVSNTLIKPFIKLHQKREDLSVNTLKEASRLAQEASVLEDKFYKKANEEKRSALTQKAVILTQARREAEDIIFQTENEISSDVASAKERIDLKSKIMLNELVIKKGEFLDLLKDKVLNP